MRACWTRRARGTISSHGTRRTPRRAGRFSTTSSTSKCHAPSPAPPSTWRSRSCAASTSRASTTSSFSIRPPTGHALDFLEAPQRLEDFLDRSMIGWFVKPYAAVGWSAWKTASRTVKFLFERIEQATGVETSASNLRVLHRDGNDVRRHHRTLTSCPCGAQERPHGVRARHRPRRAGARSRRDAHGEDGGARDAAEGRGSQSPPPAS